MIRKYSELLYKYAQDSSPDEIEANIKEFMCIAFLAGFAASGEGYNGEYPYRDLTEELNKRFDVFIELLET